MNRACAHVLALSAKRQFRSVNSFSTLNSIAKKVSQSPTATDQKEEGENGSENLPPGAQLLEEFLSVEEHDAIVKYIDFHPWQTTTDSLIQRRTQQYGWRYDYGIKGTASDMFIGVLPAFLDGVLERMVKNDVVAQDELFNQVSVNEYVDGRGIGQHTDTKEDFGEAVASVSLLSTTVINFRVPDWNPEQPSQPVLLRPRSCLVLRGAARYDWTHGISSKNRNVKQDRPPMAHTHDCFVYFLRYFRLCRTYFAAKSILEHAESPLLSEL